MSIVSLAGADYATFAAWLAAGVNAGLLGAFVLLGCYHAALGIQEIIEDYVSNETAASAAIVGVKTTFFCLTVTCIGSIFLIVMK